MNRMQVFVICILLSNIAVADSLRCGRSLVKVGDSSNALIKKCGDPIRKFSSKEYIDNDGRKVRTAVSNWVYARKSGKDMIVSVYGGGVVKMQID